MANGDIAFRYHILNFEEVYFSVPLLFCTFVGFPVLFCFYMELSTFFRSVTGMRAW